MTSDYGVVTWLESDAQDLDFQPMFFGGDVYENYIEDIDEFGRVTKIPEPNSPAAMEHIAEAAFKQCLATILGDP